MAKKTKQVSTEKTALTEVYQGKYGKTVFYDDGKTKWTVTNDLIPGIHSTGEFEAWNAAHQTDAELQR